MTRTVRAAALAALLAGCGSTSYDRVISIDRPVVSETGETAWYIESRETVTIEGRAARILQHSAVVICRPSRVPPCVRVEPVVLQNRDELNEWRFSDQADDDQGPRE